MNGKENDDKDGIDYNESDVHSCEDFDGIKFLN